MEERNKLFDTHYIATEGDLTFTRESTTPLINYSYINKALNEEQLKDLTKIEMKQTNFEKQLKVAVFLTEVENNEIISSTFLHEGWIRKPNTNSNLNLLAVKEFKLSLDDLDKIVVKEIASITF